LRYLKPRLTAVDPTLLGLAREVVRPGAVVWDVGANVGLFSFAAASVVGPAGRVVALEPDSWLVGLLRRSAALNGHLAPVEVLPVAVSDSVGVGRLHYGGEAVLARQPAIICEVDDVNAARVAELLDRYGYALYDGERPAEARHALDRAPATLLALPQHVSDRRPWTNVG